MLFGWVPSQTQHRQNSLGTFLYNSLGPKTIAPVASTMAGRFLMPSSGEGQIRWAAHPYLPGGQERRISHDVKAARVFQQIILDPTSKTMTVCQVQG